MGKIARREVELYVDGERHVWQAGETIPEEWAQFINNKSAFTGEEKHSPGNPDNETADTGFGNDRKAKKSIADTDDDGLDDFTVPQLAEYVRDNNIEIDSSNPKKQDYIDAIRESRG